MASVILVSEVDDDSAVVETFEVVVVVVITVVVVNDVVPVIKDGINGYLFNNRKEYQKKVISLIEDQTLLKEMKKEARLSAEPHSAKYFADRVLEVYMKALGNRGVKKRSFFSKMKNVIKRGLYDK